MAKSAKDLAAEKAAADRAEREKKEQATHGGPGGRLAHAGEEANADPSGNPDNVGRLDPSVATGAMPKLAGAVAANVPDGVGDDDGNEGDGNSRPPLAKPPVGTAPKYQRPAPLHEPGDGLDPVAGDGPRTPRRAADAPFELHVLAELDGDDVTVNHVVGLIREIIADLRSGDVWEALADAGELARLASAIFGAGQARTFASSVESRREAFRQFAEFDKARVEFDKVSGAVLNKVASADVSVSGAARGIGDGQFGVALGPDDFAKIIGLVQTIIGLISKLRAKRGA